MGPSFFQTRMGKTFFEHHMPILTKALTDISKELKRANDLREQELQGEKNPEYNSIELYTSLVQDAVGYCIDNDVDIDVAVDYALNNAFTIYRVTGQKIFDNVGFTLNIFRQNVQLAVKQYNERNNSKE